MDINEFLSAYENIVKGVASDQVIERTFNELFERIEGTYLEEDFRKADDKIGRIMCIDKAAHYIHSKDADLLAFAFPDADPAFVKDTLDRLSGLEAVSPVRKASRGYFTTFASAEGFVFLSKQVGVLKANRASRDEVKEDIGEYERLYKAGIASHAELLTLARYYGDKGQRYLDEIKKKSFTPDDPMVVGGYASVEVVDKEGHLITTEALQKAFFRFMDSFRTRNVNFAHSDVQAGWPLKVWINNAGEIYRSGVDDHGLYLVSEVRPDITIANKVEKEIEAGIIRSYSIAGSALDKSVETKNGRVIMVVNDLELAEISFCERPVNQESNFDIIKGYDTQKYATPAGTIGNQGPVVEKGQGQSLGEVFKGEGSGGSQLVGMSDAELKKVGEEAGANFDTNIPFDEFKMGMQIEQEHYDLTGMDPQKTAKIALAHIRESATYYTDLKAHVEKGKTEFRVSEDDLTRDEQSQNEATLRKEMSHGIDRGSNETNRQSPDVQTPVTKVGEIHMGKTGKKGLKEFKEFVGKDQPPAMAPPKPGMVWNPVSHRWVTKSETTHITSGMHPEKPKHIKVTWGDQKKSLDKLQDFVKQEGMTPVTPKKPRATVSPELKRFNDRMYNLRGSGFRHMTRPQWDAHVKREDKEWHQDHPPSFYKPPSTMKSLDKLNELVAKDLPAKPGKVVEYRRPEQTEEHSRDVARSLADQKPVGGTRTPGNTPDKEYTSRTGMLPRRIEPGDVERLPKKILKPIGYQYEKSVTESDMAGLAAFLDFVKDSKSDQR